jgi:predicted transcriptional regulator
VTIYVPPELREKLSWLPPRTISRICQQALSAEVTRRLTLRDEAVEDAFAED